MIEKIIEKEKIDFFNKIKKEILTLKEYSFDKNEFDKKYDELRKKFLKEYPSEDLTVEIIFGVRDLARAEKELAATRDVSGEKRIPKERLEELLKDLTEWQFMTTNLIIHSRNLDFIKDFWQTYGEIHKTFSDQRETYKKGIIGQAGIYKTLEKLNFKPKLSHPREDAFEKTDLWVSYPGGKEMRVQAKYTSRVDKPLIISTEEISYPAIMLYGKERDTYISSKDIEEMMHLKEFCQRRSAREGKNTRAFYIAAPERSFNNLTGEPTPEFLKIVEEEMNKFLISND